MKTTEQLRAKLAAMPREELELLAENIVITLYGEADHEADTFGLNADKEWDGDTLENVASDIINAGLHPDKL